MPDVFAYVHNLETFAAYEMFLAECGEKNAWTPATFEKMHAMREDYKTFRRTFIVNALSRGISPTIVMKWTDHASYSSMKSYIDIVDSIKATEMAKMNFMD